MSLSFVPVRIPEIMCLRFLSCWAKSFSSIPESFREDRVPGTSSEATLDNFFIEAPNLPKAIIVGIDARATDKNAPKAIESGNKIDRSPNSGLG